MKCCFEHLSFDPRTPHKNVGKCQLRYMLTCILRNLICYLTSFAVFPPMRTVTLSPQVDMRTCSSTILHLDDYIMTTWSVQEVSYLCWNLHCNIRSEKSRPFVSRVVAQPRPTNPTTHNDEKAFRQQTLRLNSISSVTVRLWWCRSLVKIVTTGRAAGNRYHVDAWHVWCQHHDFWRLDDSNRNNQIENILQE